MNVAKGSFLQLVPTNTVESLPQAWQAENPGTSAMLTSVCRPPVFNSYIGATLREADPVPIPNLEH